MIGRVPDRTNSRPGFFARRRDRLAQERTRRQLERQRELEAQVAQQVGHTLGPAGRPMSASQAAVWRRDQVAAYLALPPWRRAWLTWKQWGHLRRLAIALAVVPLWPVLMLPLRMTGLATVEASQIGVIVLLAIVPFAVFTPPGRRDRFSHELGRARPAWGGSRVARRYRRALVAAGAALTLGIGFAAWLGPGPEDLAAGERSTAAQRADRIVIENTLAESCDAPIERSEPVGGDRYRVTLSDGTVTQVEIDWPGRAPSGTGAGHGRVVGTPPVC